MKFRTGLIFIVIVDGRTLGASECWVGSEEFSSLALNNARIGIVTGTKVIIDSIIEANENSLTKYMKENFENV